MSGKTENHSTAQVPKRGTKEAKVGTKKKQKVEKLALTNAEKTVVLIQFGKKNNLSYELIQRILTEYLRFMELKKEETGATWNWAPSKLVDEMWHAQ
jgi:hypothetical protein